MRPRRCPLRLLGEAALRVAEVDVTPARLPDRRAMPYILCTFLFLSRWDLLYIALVQ